MKNIYISRPLRENLRHSYKLIEQVIKKKIRDKEILIDPKDRYEILKYYYWTENTDIPLSDYYVYYERRLINIAMSDLVIFIEDWMDLIECKFDWAIMTRFKEINYLSFKSSIDSNGKIDLKSVEDLSQKL